MTLKAYKHIIVCFFLFFLSFTSFTQNQLNINVQPYNGTEFFADGEKIIPKLIKKDNTLGLFKFQLKKEIQNLEIKNKGFKSVLLPSEKLFKAALMSEVFVILSPENSLYEVVNIFKTGNKPKSITFIGSDTVAAALLDGNGIDIINVNTGETKRISPPKEYADKLGFVEALVLKHKNELWVSQMSTACIHVFDLNTFEYKTTVQSSGQWSKVILYNPLENRIYLSNWISKNISIINPDTYKEEKKIKTENVPRGMAFTEDGKNIYFAQFEDSHGISNCKLIKKDLHTFKTLKEMGKKGAKRHIITDYTKNRLYVSDMLNNTVEVYSLKEDILLKTIKVFSHPNTMQISPDNKKLYVSCRGPNNPQKGYLYKGFVMGHLDIIDTENLTLLESIEAGNQPTGLDVSPDGKIIVLSDFLDNRIRVIKKKQKN